MIRIPWFRIRHTGVADPYVFARAGFKLVSSDSCSGSKKGTVRNQIRKQDFVSVSEFLSFKSARQQQNTTILSEIKI